MYLVRKDSLRTMDCASETGYLMDVSFEKC